VKVVGGKVTRLGNLGLVETGSGTTVSVRMQGKRLTFFVNGSRERTLTDASLTGERRAGMIGAGGKNAHARWTEFLFAPNGQRS
jgi:hypothetical protein